MPTARTSVVSFTGRVGAGVGGCEGFPLSGSLSLRFAAAHPSVGPQLQLDHYMQVRLEMIDG